MTKNEKLFYLDQKTVAYYSGWNGIEIKGIEYGINDYIIYITNAFTSNKKVHKTRVYYSSGENDYFIADGKRIKLNECLRRF